MFEGRQTRKRRWIEKVVQDVRVFVRLFPWWIAAVMAVGLVVTAWGYQIVYHRLYGPGSLTYVQAMLLVIRILQLDHDVPAPAPLDVFFVLIPLIGLPLVLLLGVNVIDVLRVFFVRADRGQAWQAALASTIDDHILICGLGRVGYRLANQLLAFQMPVVGINNVPSPLVDDLIDQGLPVILGDVRNVEVLKTAGVERARTVVICTDQDLVNIGTAFHVQTVNPKAHLVLRFFEDEIVDAIRKSFDIDAVISRSALAAVYFAHAALGIEVIETFQLSRQSYVLARIPLEENSPLLDRTVADVSKAEDLTVVFHRRGRRLQLEPPPDLVLQAGDDLFVFVASEQLNRLLRQDLLDNRSRCGIQKRPVVVCGLGHIGYRVALRLQDMECPVIGVDFEPGRLSGRLEATGVSVHYADFRQRTALAQIGVGEAAALVACTEDDMTNLETVLRARELNPQIRLVLRLFEEGLGEHLHQTFGIHAVYSTSAIANPAFLSAALQMHVAQRVEVDGVEHFIARLEVKALSALVGVTVAELHQEDNLTPVLHAHDKALDIPPVPERRLGIGDTLVVLASQDKLREMAERNRSLHELGNHRWTSSRLHMKKGGKNRISGLSYFKGVRPSK
ncbi:MAG: potassium channel family protein [Anaerolineae bacterium]